MNRYKQLSQSKFSVLFFLTLLFAVGPCSTDIQYAAHANGKMRKFRKGKGPRRGQLTKTFNRAAKPRKSIKKDFNAKANPRKQKGNLRNSFNKASRPKKRAARKRIRGKFNLKSKYAPKPGMKGRYKARFNRRAKGKERMKKEFFRASRKKAAYDFNKVSNRVEIPKWKINKGAQGKHIPGSSTYEKGRSVLKANAAKLLNGTRSGKYRILRRNGRHKVVVDFGSYIGKWNNNLKTQYGQIHYGKKGAHIVPSRPVQIPLRTVFNNNSRKKK